MPKDEIKDDELLIDSTSFVRSSESKPNGGDLVITNFLSGIINNKHRKFEVGSVQIGLREDAARLHFVDVSMDIETKLYIEPKDIRMIADFFMQMVKVLDSKAEALCVKDEE